MKSVDIDLQMMWATLVALHNEPKVAGPELYNTLRDMDRAKHPYSVAVDENLLTVQGGYDRYDEGNGGVTIALPFIRGVGSIYKRYTQGRGSSVNLRAFNITIAGQKEPIVIYQGEPIWWAEGGAKLIKALQDQEMTWHIRQLTIVRHKVLAELNAYINRVRELEPQNRQLKLGAVTCSDLETE